MYAHMRQDEAKLFAKLKTDAQMLAVELWATLAPHMEHMAYVARLTNASLTFGNTAADWPKAFLPAITPVFERALCLRFKLLGLDIRHEFVWYSHGAVVEPHLVTDNVNKTFSSHATVAYTEFPGLRITELEKGVESKTYDYRAVVQAREV